MLLPETLAAIRNARRERVQVSVNLAYGSALASFALTIPAIAIASIWLSGPLSSRGPAQPGRATPQRGLTRIEPGITNS